MQVKWWVPVLVGSALFSACGDGSTASSTTAVNLSSTAFATLAPTETTAVVVTTIETNLDGGQIETERNSQTYNVPVSVDPVADAVSIAGSSTVIDT